MKTNCMGCCGGEQLAATITALAAIIADGKSIEELDLLTVAFSMLGDAIGVIAAQRAICQSKCDSIVDN